MRWLAGFVLSLAAALAGELPKLVVPNGSGVNIHFVRGHAKDLDMIAAAGFRVVRMDFGWAGIERERGKYDWSEYDELTANLEQRGIRPYYILDYSNPLYEERVTSKNPVTGREHTDIASPQHPESVEAFARWAGASAKHFAGKNIIWEIWNEPNITFWKPKPDVQQYTDLAMAAAKSIRAAVPEAIIAGPATSQAPEKYLEDFFQSGVLDLLDAVSFHPYRNYKRGPETAGEDYRRVRELIEKYAPAGKKRMPLISGEWGYASHRTGVSEEEQAAFLVRQQLYNLFENIPVSIWYDWKNDGIDPSEREENFGTVTHDLKPKPAYTALKTMTGELNGFTLKKRIENGKLQDFLLLFEKDGEQRLAAWTAREPHETKLVFTSSPAEIPALRAPDRRETLKVRNREIEIELQPAPVYLRLGTARIKQ